MTRRVVAPRKATVGKGVDARLGGAHPDSAVLKDLLRLSGIVDAETKQPLSEPMCFGIAGGIAAGYTFVPELQATGLGSGVTFVGRHRQFLTDARWHTEFCRRLGIRCLAAEEPNPERAFENLAAGLKAKRPVIAWCSPVLFPHLSWASTAGMYTLLVHSLDKKKHEVVVSDCGPEPFKLSLEDLASIRGRVNPLQNRLLVIDPPAKIDRDALVAAAIAGIKACLFGSRDLEQRGHRSIPIDEVAGWLAQLHHSAGWRVLFPDARIFLALSDTFQSVEASWNGGGFFRPLFADFLDETAALSGKKAIAKCAESVRRLGKKWTAFAEAALPKRYAAFAKTRDALAKVEKLYRAKGRKADPAILKERAALAEAEKSALDRFPLDGHDVNRLLDDLAERLTELAADERDSASELRAAL